MAKAARGAVVAAKTAAAMAVVEKEVRTIVGYQDAHAYGVRTCATEALDGTWLTTLVTGCALMGLQGVLTPASERQMQGLPVSLNRKGGCQ